MKKIIYVLAFLFIVHCTLHIEDCAGQWIQQSVPVTSGYFLDMKFINHNTGFISNSTGKLLKTTNSGYDWILLKELLMLSLSTVDSMYIYAAGMTTGYGRLYKSTNCGINWDSLLISGSYTYHYIHFFNRDTGLISGSNSTSNLIWRTIDGGQSVQLVQMIDVSSVGKFFFLKEKVNGEYYGWMYYPGGSQLRATTNSGLTWNSLPNFSSTAHLNSIFFINKDTGWATITSYTNYIYLTTNGGVNWTGKYNGLNEVYYDIYFTNSLKGWVSGLINNICVTTNGGSNWGTQSVLSSYTSKLFFLDSLNGWLETSSTTIAHTTNGGGPITSAIPNNNFIASDYKLYQNYPNPFNPSTSIKYYLKSKSFVELKIYDISGKEVFNLVSKEQGTGDYKKSIDFTGKTSGIYFYRIIVRDNSLNTVFCETKRMIYLK